MHRRYGLCRPSCAQGVAIIYLTGWCPSSNAVQIYQVLGLTLQRVSTLAWLGMLSVQFLENLIESMMIHIQIRLSSATRASR